jgi:hypothetical protein
VIKPTQDILGTVKGGSAYLPVDGGDVLRPIKDVWLLYNRFLTTNYK